MSVLVRVPRDAAARKPRHGSPCNNCGVCCMVMQCKLSLHCFGPQPLPCPALEIDKHGISSCGLVTAPELDDESVQAALLIIGADTGCDCRINGEPINTAFNAELDRRDQERAAEIAAARKVWSMREERS